jgi:hypothetical protein
MPIALRPEVRPWEGSGWRAVEAQHRNATIALTRGDRNRQALLEEIIEEQAKPALPANAAGLHFLLATPFRYRSPPPDGSRFRGRHDPGVFYGAESVKTACAEAGYWRLRFWMDSEGLRTKAASLPMTLFEFHGATHASLDLTRPPFLARRKLWTQPGDYGETQALAQGARAEGVELIRYESVRHPVDGRCLAILSPAVFRAVAEPYRHQQQSWSLFLGPPDLIVWQRNLDGDSFEFRFTIQN